MEKTISTLCGKIRIKREPCDCGGDDVYDGEEELELSSHFHHTYRSPSTSLLERSNEVQAQPPNAAIGNILTKEQMTSEELTLREDADDTTSMFWANQRTAANDLTCVIVKTESLAGKMCDVNETGDSGTSALQHSTEMVSHGELCGVSVGAIKSEPGTEDVSRLDESGGEPSFPEPGTVQEDLNANILEDVSKIIKTEPFREEMRTVNDDMTLPIAEGIKQSGIVIKTEPEAEGMFSEKTDETMLGSGVTQSVFYPAGMVIKTEPMTDEMSFGNQTNHSDTMKTLPWIANVTKVEPDTCTFVTYSALGEPTKWKKAASEQKKRNKKKAGSEQKKWNNKKKAASEQTVRKKKKAASEQTIRRKKKKKKAASEAYNIDNLASDAASDGEPNSNDDGHSEDSTADSMRFWTDEERAFGVEAFHMTKSISKARRKFQKHFKCQRIPSISTMLRWVKKLEDEGTLTNLHAKRKHMGRKRRARSAENIRAVLECVEGAPHKSLREIAKEVGISPNSVRRILVFDLDFSYHPSHLENGGAGGDNYNGDDGGDDGSVVGDDADTKGEIINSPKVELEEETPPKKKSKSAPNMTKNPARSGSVSTKTKPKSKPKKKKAATKSAKKTQPCSDSKPTLATFSRSRKRKQSSIDSESESFSALKVLKVEIAEKVETPD